jgi:hypothetical protein
VIPVLVPDDDAGCGWPEVSDLLGGPPYARDFSLARETQTIPAGLFDGLPGDDDPEETL